jgi:uncharacterized protein YndB with AHSA1/START domain
MTATVTQDAVTHDAFSIERRYRHAPAKVFAAFSDPDARRRWLIEGEGFTVESYEPGFGAGAFERSSFRFKGGPLIRNDTVFLDVVPERRVIFAYAMTLEEDPMSSSLVTVLFVPDGDGTRLSLTEQGAYIGRYADVGGREAGMRELLDALAGELDR